jgi:sialic acid synthase SpsE
MSEGPSKSLKPENNWYNGLLGEWEVAWLQGQDSSDEKIMASEWMFAWINNGEALQDVLSLPFRWLKPPSGVNSLSMTTARHFNATRKAWAGFHIHSGQMCYFGGTRNQNQAIEPYQMENGPIMAWVFENIQPDSFKVAISQSTDNGSTFKMVGEIGLKREAIQLINEPDISHIHQFGQTLAPLPWLVAEIGGNHGGDPQKARQLCQAAKKAGAGAIKFQAYRTELFIHPQNPYYAELAQEELPLATLADLIALTHDLGLMAGLTVFGSEGLELAQKAQADYLKISSGDLTYHPLIRLASQLPQPLVISTGASDAAEVQASVALCPTPPTVLQCACLYPAPETTLSLAVLAQWLKKGLKAGLSDHSLELEPARAALCMGAVMVEKHFTLDRQWPGGDNAISSLSEDFQVLANLAATPPTPLEAQLFINHLAKTKPLYWGNPTKTRQPGENPSLVRRWAVAAKNLSQGQWLKPTDIQFLRTPPTPTPLLGPEEPWIERQLKRDLAQGTPVALADLLEENKTIKGTNNDN